MKKIAIYSLIVLAVANLFTACRKEDNTKLPDGLARFPLPQLTKVAGTHQVISAVNPAAFVGKFTVGMYFPGDVPPQKYDVVVIKNDDKTNVKLVQAGVTSFPTEITVTGPQLISLFGGTIVLGDRFDFGVDVTTSTGMKFEAFPTTGLAYASGIGAQPGATPIIRYSAICQYDPQFYRGNFEVLVDEWADYAVGETVVLTMVDANKFSFTFRADAPKQIVVTVNADNSVTVPKQVYGSGYGGASWPYGDISAESVPSIDNNVSPCQGTFSVRLKHTVAAGTFGSGTELLRLRKL